ncbi:hypothetical protein BKA66DRAFT_477358 [Pyrenochaeta sp. MPI-SDFR-AT-0127]|nr:hypothetical protein BKA66DRAFT_477358 [Pyrenochaeta sp. MPI-SDFR-AT-0127]
MALNGDPSLPVPVDTQREILKHLWRQTRPATTNATDLHWDSYFAYYTSECNSAIQYERGKFTSVRTHTNITTIAEQLQEQHSKADLKQKLLPSLKQQRTSDEKDAMLEGSIMLVARLLSMVDIGPLPYVPGRQPSLIWDDDTMSLKTLLESRFNQNPTDGPEGMGFEEDFTAYNCQRYAGVEFVWTDNLADHLHMSRSRKRVSVFHHASFLRWQDDVLPEGLAAETLKTLALLFPSHDPKTRKWIESICASSKPPVELDLQMLECGRLRDGQLSEFKFWRKELVALQKVFNEPHQTSIFQQWRDKRNSTQWYTFWIAVVVLCFTLFFGFVQSIEGAIQVYKAYHPSKD